MQSFKSIFRHGLIFGFGLIIPLTLINVGSNAFKYLLSAAYYSGEDSGASYQAKEENHIKNITIQEFHDVREGNFVMVLGSIKNDGKTKASSIKLEAEFFDDKGQFVYEETEYVEKSLQPGEVENFAIKCGCANRVFPEYSKVTVRIVNLSNY